MQQQYQLADNEIYDIILLHQNHLLAVHQVRGEGACLLHSILKTVPLFIIYFKSFMMRFVSDMLAKQICLVLIIVDFWFTKNYNGPKMMGIRWFFKQSIDGKDRFNYQFRVNQEFIGPGGVRTFWTISILYFFLPLCYYYIVGLDFDIPETQVYDFILLFMMSVSSFINLYMFYKAKSYAFRKRRELIRRWGTDFVQKLGMTSGFCQL